jgi:hypothetical protein
LDLYHEKKCRVAQVVAIFQYWKVKSKTFDEKTDIKTTFKDWFAKVQRRIQEIVEFLKT